MGPIPLKVGELYATMRLDNKAFDSALDKSGAKFQSLGEGISKGAQGAARVFAATTTAVVGLGAAALNVGLDYNRMQQTSRAALTQLLGSTEAVNAQMAKLDEFASTSPFAKQVFIQAQQQLIGFGMSAEKVIPTLDAIQNAVAAVGGSNEDISEITRILATVTSSGKITAETLNQLGVRGVDAATLIGKAMGMTGQEVRDSITSGTLDAGQAVDALVAGMTDSFGGATALVKQQMDGAVDRVKGAWRDIGSVMATPLIDPNGGGQLVEWTNLLADGLRQVQKQAEPVTAILWGRMGPGIDLVTVGLKKAVAAVAGWDSKNLERGLETISGYGPLIAGLGTAFFTLGTNSLPVLASLGIHLNPVVAGIAALVAFSPQLRAVAGDLLDAFKPAIVPAKELATVVADFLMAALDAVAPALSDLAIAGGDVAVLFLNMLVPAVKAGADMLLPLVEGGADLVSMFTKLPTPILATVAALAGMKALGLTGVIKTFTASVPGMLKPASGAFETFRLQMMYATEGASGLKTAMGPASAALGKFAGAMKAAFINNAPMLAITALITALTYFSQQASEAKARADSYRDALKGLVIGSDEAKESLADLAAQNAVTGDDLTWGWLEKMGAGADSFNEALKKAGSSAKEFGEAISGSDADFAEYVTNLEAQATAAGLSAYATIGLIRETSKQRDAQKAGVDAAMDLDEATRRTAEANEAYADRLSRAASATDRLRQAEQDLAASKGDLKMAEYATKDAMDALTQAIEENSSAARDANGIVDESSDAYRAFDESMIGAERAWRTQIDAMVKAKAPQDEINAKIAEGRQQLLDQATAFFGSEEAARAYLDSLGGIPDTVSTVVELGTDAAQKDIDTLFAQVTDANPVMAIDARDDPAVATLMRTLGYVEDETGIFGLDAKNDEALAKLLLTLGIVDTSEGTVKLLGNNKPGMDKLNELVAEINKKHGAVTVQALDGTIQTVSNIIAAINQKHAYITVGARPGSSANTGMTGVIGANGGIFDVARGVQSFANGGISPLPNQALIQAGSGKGLINWAEGETWREAFIPYNPAKRARSLAVLDQVARDFGYSLVRPQSFANGGVSGPPVSRQIESAYSGVQGVTIQQLVVDISKVRTLAEFESWVRGLGLDLGMQGAL